MNSRAALTTVALVVAAALLALQFRNLLNDRTVLPPDDFVEYWAAGRLNARGENPYDPDKLLPLEREAGRDTDEAIMMWNPPWTLAVAMPFGLMDARAAQLLWLLLGFAAVAVGADALWTIYGGPRERRWVAWLLAFTFLPTFFVLAAGQIGTWMLAGGVLFLVCLRKGWPLLAGATAALMAVKPHLVYLVWVVLAVRAFRGKDGKIVLGGVIAGVIATAIPLALNPHVLGQYWQEMTQRPPAQWVSPTLGTVIRSVEGPDRFGQQFIPALLGLGWLAWYARKHRNREWDWARELPLLLLVSFVTAAYGAWPFDLVILLPAVIQVAARVARQPRRETVVAGCIAWALINVPALVLNRLHVGSFWFIWVAPALLAAYLFLMRKTGPA
jgi:hypothetical protein